MSPGEGNFGCRNIIDMHKKEYYLVSNVYDWSKYNYEGEKLQLEGLVVQPAPMYRQVALWNKAIIHQSSTIEALYPLSLTKHPHSCTVAGAQSTERRARCENKVLTRCAPLVKKHCLQITCFREISERHELSYASSRQQVEGQDGEYS